MEEAVHLLIIADDPLARAGLAMLFTGEPDLITAAQLDRHTFTADPATELAEAQAEVVVWDMGWEAADVESLLLGEIGVPVVALVADESDAPEVWAAGAQAVLLRELDTERLCAAVRAAAQGLVILDAPIARALLPAERSLEPEFVESLTPREDEVLQLLAEGLTNKAIGARLAISEHTVKFHVNAILSKLNAQSRTEAVVRATQLGRIAL